MPEIINEYMLDMLTDKTVSVVKKVFIIIEEGAERQPVGKPIRTSYANNSLGRAAVVAELPENFAAGILAVWGDNPSVPDPPAPLPIDPRTNDEEVNT